MREDLAAADEGSARTRDALLKRLGDEDFDVRSEALFGLARRRDDRAVEALKEALRGEAVGELMIEAAGFYGRNDLVPLLEALIEPTGTDPPDRLLQAAIQRCRGEASAEWHWDDLA